MEGSAPVVIAAVVWIVAMGVGGRTLTRLDQWYYNLRQPPWKPSDVLFGPVWTTIFLCAAVALVLGWRSPVATAATRAALVAAYLANTVLNLYWSYLFFRRHRPDLALWETALLWLSIVGMIVVLWPLSRVAASLIAPYLLWVSFASVLTRAVVKLNRPFAS